MLVPALVRLREAREGEMRKQRFPRRRRGSDACFYFSGKRSVGLFAGLVAARVYDEELAAGFFLLFDRHGFRQIAWLVDVAAAAHGDVVSEELQGNYFQQGRENFWCGGQLDDVVGGLAR